MGGRVAVQLQWVLALGHRVKLGGLGRVQALHAAPGAVLVWAFSKVSFTRVKPSRKICGRGTERHQRKREKVKFGR